MSRVKWNQAAADAVMACFTEPRKGAADTSPVLQFFRIRERTKLSHAELKETLAALVALGDLIRVRNDRYGLSEEDILYGLASAQAVYYMLPERLKELEALREKRLQAPYMDMAQQLVLDKYADEVKAEFDRLWAEKKEN